MLTEKKSGLFLILSQKANNESYKYSQIIENRGLYLGLLHLLKKIFFSSNGPVRDRMSVEM